MHWPNAGDATQAGEIVWQEWVFAQKFTWMRKWMEWWQIWTVG